MISYVKHQLNDVELSSLKPHSPETSAAPQSKWDMAGYEEQRWQTGEHKDYGKGGNMHTASRS